MKFSIGIVHLLCLPLAVHGQSQSRGRTVPHGREKIGLEQEFWGRVEREFLSSFTSSEAGVRTTTLSPTSTPTSKPSSTPTGKPTSTPTGTPTSTPTGKPTSMPTGTPSLTPTGKPTSNPTGTPSSSPSSKPSYSAAPSTPAPTFTASPTESHAPTVSPQPTITPSPTFTASPTVSAKPTVSPAPSKSSAPTSSPAPTVSAKPSISPAPSQSSAPTSSPRPTVSAKPTVSPAPSHSPAPTVTPQPTASFSPTVSAKPTTSFAPTYASAAPTSKRCFVLTEINCLDEDNESCNFVDPAGEQCIGGSAQELRFIYNADTFCGGDSNTQGDFICQDAAESRPTTVYIKAFADESTFFEGVVSEGNVFSIFVPDGATSIDIEIRSLTNIFLFGDILQQMRMSVQCREEDALILMDTFGALQLVGFKNEEEGLKSVYTDVTIEYMAENIGTRDLIITGASKTSPMTGQLSLLYGSDKILSPPGDTRVFSDLLTVNLNALVGGPGLNFRLDVKGEDGTTGEECEDLDIYTLQVKA